MKIKKLAIFMVTLFCGTLFACQDRTQPMEENEDETDTLTVLQHLQERGTLKAVTNCELINYNTQNAKPSGFEFELLSDFCKANNLELEMVVNENLDSCFSLLDSCKVDVVAVGIGSNKDVKRRFLVTNPILLQRSVLVQRMPKDWKKMSTANEVENQLLRSPLDLAGKTIHLPSGSHEVKLLNHLSDQIGDTIYVVECDTMNSVDLVQAVSEGMIDYTVVEEYVARMASIGLGGLDTKLMVSVEQPLGWALANHEGDSSLLLAVNSWIDSFEQRNLNRILAKYVNKGNVFGTKKPKAGELSGFDAIIKKTAKEIGWDWRLLASLIFQESHFRLDLESEKGAFGLMQLMPVVMERYEIDYDATPEEQLEAGGKLIKYLGDCLANKVADSTERVKFVLASYNAGLGHVYDAQRLALKYGKDPEVWDNNVDYFILNKSKAQYYNDTCCKAGYLRGTETYRFVEEVLDRYYQYQATYN
ncbi:MAG: transporter substrate-binding domain-containing protein [Bacteroidales bacterium]|nr:transporter substrate-binding domain-containing protein [Bacteroidales bacterium]